jgi:hypothetical protein
MKQLETPQKANLVSANQLPRYRYQVLATTTTHYQSKSYKGEKEGREGKGRLGTLGLSVAGHRHQ